MQPELSRLLSPPAAAMALCLAAAGCQAPGPSSPRACDESRGTVSLRAVKLVEKAPSPQFTVPSGATAWVRVDVLPTSAGGLFGQAAGAAELHALSAGAAPRLRTAANGDVTADDPAIEIHKAVEWEPASLSAGSWQLYSLSNPTISVMTCPAG